jgi:putative nucleotidyltransferase with HDIG domain
MKRPLSIATRTFLLTFFSMCAVLIAGFFALNAALKARIKEGLKENLVLTEKQLDRQEAEYDQRDVEVIATLSQNASLKAAIGLSREQSKPSLQGQVRETIEDQLRDLSKGLNFDIFLVIDSEGVVIATVGARVDDNQARQFTSDLTNGPWLIRSGHDLYKIRSVPINLGDENLGRLAVGRRFVLSSPGAFGYAVLTDRTGIADSTLPAALNSEVAQQLSDKCGQLKNGCEIQAGGQTYLALGMDGNWVTPDFKLLRFASIDDAMRGFTASLRRTLFMVGLGGVLMAMLFSLIASRSISQPLSNLAVDIERSGKTGALWNDFSVDSSTHEVNLLASALNRAASARRQVEGELRSARDGAEAATNRVELTYDDTLQALGAALDLRDNETAGHSHRVTRYCLELAKRIGCSGEQLKHIERGAYLHDIGKIGTPDAILLKPGKLTSEEREIMQQHARVGYELVSRIEFLQDAAEIVHTHQERYDGKGYPQGLAGDAIPLGARIFAVADTFDAMTSNRPYRNALPLAVALEEINNESGRQFDPKVVEVLRTIPPVVWEGIRREVSGLGGSFASKRAALQTRVIWKKDDARLSSMSVNISESGMLLEPPGSLVLGEELELEFCLPQTSEPLKPRVQIVRKESRGIGVRFVTLTLEARQIIRRHIDVKAKQPVAS